jgi:hypothetical protein
MNCSDIQTPQPLSLSLSLRRRLAAVLRINFGFAEGLPFFTIGRKKNSASTSSA